MTIRNFLTRVLRDLAFKAPDTYSGIIGTTFILKHFNKFGIDSFLKQKL